MLRVGIVQVVLVVVPVVVPVLQITLKRDVMTVIAAIIHKVSSQQNSNDKGIALGLSFVLYLYFLELFVLSYGECERITYSKL